MTRQEKIKWLSQYRKTSMQYSLAFESYVSSKYKIISIKAQIMSGMPMCSGVSSDKIINSLIELETLERKLLAILKQMQAMRNNIKYKIREIENNNIRNILTQRYINGYRWKDIILQKRKSTAQIFRLHIEGLDKLKI